MLGLLGIFWKEGIKLEAILGLLGVGVTPETADRWREAVSEIPIVGDVVNTIDALVFGIWELISSLVTLLNDVFKDLPYITGLLGSFAVNIPGYFSWLPGGVSGLLVTTFAIVIVYMIANRK